jgi:hypothetical protein
MSFDALAFLEGLYRTPVAASAARLLQREMATLPDPPPGFCPDDLPQDWFEFWEDRVAIMVEGGRLAWICFVRMAENGKDAEGFQATFVFTVARSVQCGRRLTGMEKAKDVMSGRAQRRHGFTVDSIDEPLKANTITPVPDQAAFRIDFKEWLRTLTSRERKIVRAMLRDERTLDLSRQFDLSPGRISQMRREFAESWSRYCG